MERKKKMKGVKSLCPDSIRKYYRIPDSPMQISINENEDGGNYKIQIKRSGVRVEDNRIVFEMTPEQMSDLGDVTKRVLENDAY